MKNKFLFAFILFVNLNCHSQVTKAIDELDSKHEKCLDNVKNNMMNCTLEYYAGINNLLNETYRKIKKSLSKPEQQKLKELQLLWLKKRDKYFSQVKKDTQELDIDPSSQDFRMICAHANAVFVKERILELEKIYSK